MPNIVREHSEYEYQVPEAQLKALLDIAFKKDCDIQSLFLAALDEYIQREDQRCSK